MATTKTELYNNGTLVATKTSAPFNTFDWTPASGEVGSASLTVKRYEDGVLVATSAAVGGTVEEAGVITFPAWEENADNATSYFNAFNNNLKTFDNTVSAVMTSKSNVYGAAVAPSGKIYFPSYLTTYAWTFDPSTGLTEQFGTFPGSYDYKDAVIAPNGFIYLIPYRANIAKINPADNTVTDLGGITGLSGSATVNRFAKGILANNGKIYFIPFISDRIVVFDPTNDTYSLTSDVFSTDPKWESACLLKDGRIFATPYADGEPFLIINPVDNTTVTITPSDGLKHGKPCVAPNGIVYAATDTKVLRFDPSNDTHTILTAPTGLNSISGTILGVDGLIYGFPGGNGKLLILDPADDSMSVGLSNSALNSTNGAVLAKDGNLYAIPQSTTKLLKIGNSTETLTDNQILSRYLNN